MKEIKATLVYVTNNDHVLMIHRNRKPGDEHKGKYNGLGGKLEPAETHLECAIREVKEESGLNIIGPIFKGEILFPKFDKNGNDWRVYIYRADTFTDELIKHNREGDLEWVAQSKILSLNLWEGDKHFLPYVFKEGTFKGTLYYSEGKLDPKKSINIEHKI